MHTFVPSLGAHSQLYDLGTYPATAVPSMDEQSHWDGKGQKEKKNPTPQQVEHAPSWTKYL